MVCILSYNSSVFCVQIELQKTSPDNSSAQEISSCGAECRKKAREKERKIEGKEAIIWLIHVTLAFLPSSGKGDYSEGHQGCLKIAEEIFIMSNFVSKFDEQYNLMSMTGC